MFGVDAMPAASECAPKVHLSQASFTYGVLTPGDLKSPLLFISSRTRSENAFVSVWS